MKFARTLHDPETDASWEAQVDEGLVSTRAGRGSNLRESKRSFASYEEARDWVLKQGWTKLKKGYVLLSASGDGNPLAMQRVVDQIYTGAMPLLGLDEALLCSQHVKVEGRVEQKLLALSGDGDILHEWHSWPDSLAWSFRRTVRRDIILMGCDGHVVELDTRTGEMEALSGADTVSPNSLSVGGERAAWFQKGKVVVMDLLSRRTVLSIPRAPEMYGGHTPQTSLALSSLGDVLAVCSTPGEVDLFQVESGEFMGRIATRGGLVDQLEFDASGETLVVTEKYKNWGLQVFDVAKKREKKDRTRAFTNATGAVTSCTFDPSRERLAVVEGRQISLYDFDSTKRIAVFTPERVAKRVEVAFHGKRIAFRSDLGCVGVLREPDG